MLKAIWQYFTSHGDPSKTGISQIRETAKANKKEDKSEKVVAQ